MPLVSIEDISTLNTLRQQRINDLIQLYAPTTQYDGCAFKVPQSVICGSSTGGEGTGGTGGIGGGWE